MQGLLVQKPLAGGQCSATRRQQLGAKPCRLVATRAGSNGASPAVCELKAGAKIKVSAPVTVYHVSKFGKDGLNLQGLEGVAVSDEAQYKGLTLSANLPWKCQFAVKAPGGDKELKVIAHLAADEFEVVN